MTTEICGISNITLVSHSIPIEHILSVKPNEKKIDGLMGKCIDDMLGKISDRKCNLIAADDFGVKLSNGTWTGAMGLLQSGRGHAYLKGEPHFINEEWLQRSLPLRAENIWAGQMLKDENKLDYFDLLENFKFSLEFYLSYFLTFLVFGFSCFYLIRSNLIGNRIYSRLTNGLKFIYFISYLFISRKFKFKLILLFLGLFLWFTLLFITNTIKTNKVVVDTSELFKNKDELMKSKFVCFFKDDTAYNLALNSQKNSYLFRLLDEKTKFKNLFLKIEKCHILRNPNYFNYLFSRNIEIIITQIEAMGLILTLSSFNSAKKIFILSKGIQEYSAVIYYLKYKSNMDFNWENYMQMKRRFGYAINEHGTNQKLYSCMENNAETVFKKTMKIYYDVSEYINDNQNFSNLELNNFSSLFIIYFGFLTIIFIIFLIFQFVPFYYSKLIDKLSTYWSNFITKLN